MWNCTLTRNWANGNPGGGGSYGGILYNCLIAGNSSGIPGPCDAQGGGANFGTLYNCTIIRNSSGREGGGARMASLVNCIVYYNFTRNYGVESNVSACAMTNTCTTKSATSASFVNCITNEPMLVNSGSGYGTNFTAGANYRLTDASPCINTGTNQPWTDGAVDLGGQKRVLYGTVDMGAFENVFESTIYIIR